MKKVLLIGICVLSIFSLRAQINENFSDYTVGGKIAQQAMEMGKEYWTTWSNAPGGSEDGSIAELEGNKVASLVANNDQVLLFGEKTTGVYNIEFDMYVPTGKVGYFNVLADFAGSNSEWAMQVYANAINTGQQGDPTTYTPGSGTLHAGGAQAATFTCTQDDWIHFKVNVNLNSDIGTFFVNGEQIHQWTWSLGSFGDDNLRQLEAINIYCDPEDNMEFYADNFVFEAEGGASIIFETGFDDVDAGSLLAQSYSDFWTTWSNAPGGTEDAVISNTYSSSEPQSAEFNFAGGDDVVFLAGDKTSGTYQIDFDMYIPGTNPAFFNLLHIFNGSSSEWAAGMYFNVTESGMPAGTCIQIDGATTNFTAPSSEWFHVTIEVMLDADLATFSINDEPIKEWVFSLKESGGTGLRQLAAIDFYPPQAGSVYYIDNFVYASAGGDFFPVMNVTPASINQELAPGQVATETVTVANTGTSIGDYFSWITYDAAVGGSGTGESTITYSTDITNGAIGFSNGNEMLIEYGAKLTAPMYGHAMGTSIDQVSFFCVNNVVNETYVIRVYDQGSFNVPGEVLAETTVTNPTLEAWNTVDLPSTILLTGRDVWVTVEFTQIATTGTETFAMAIDNSGTPTENADWNRHSGGSWDQLHIENPSLSTQGACMVKALSQGSPVPGSWAILSGTTYGSLLAGASSNYNININAAGLAQDTYHATLHVTTNDEENPLFEIPITLEVITSDCDVPTNLVATVNQNEMSIGLTWEGAFEGGWITWSGEPDANAIGTGAAADFSVAHRYETSDLTPYSGMTLSKIKFVPAEAACTYSVRVWTGGNATGPATLVVDQEVANVTIGDWNEVILNSPVTINVNQELWIGYRCNTTTGHPAGCDAGPQVPLKGNMMLFQGSWDELSNLGDFNFNWTIQGYVGAAKGEEVALTALVDNSQNTTGTFSAATVPFTPSKAVTSDITYNVYRDGAKIAEGLTETAYVDENLEAGEYCYTVTTSCPAGEGLPSNESCGDLLEPCNAPEVTAIGESETSSPAIHIMWDAVPGAETYKVFYANSPVTQNITETEVYITGGIVANVEYCFTVKTYCENGLISVASEEACATYIPPSVSEFENNFNIFPNPANTQVTVEGENIDHIAIFNMVGQLIETSDLTTINTAAYNNGVYIFRIITNDGNVATKRVVINH